MTYIETSNWVPSPGIRIEGKALDIVKSQTSGSVLAGPGAGKTELLAQRANYLLTTGLCPPPRRILAIAFKVDAARNLSSRVKERCDPMQAQRFESLTLDAFAKRLIDQFLEAIPSHWRPSSNYTISFPNRNTWEQFRNNISDRCPAVKTKNDSQIELIVHRSVPDFHFEESTTLDHKIQWLWWQEQMSATPSRLTFDMIKCMALFILKNNPVILSALRHTFSHVFLDEFQDITGRQYELIRTAFLGSDSVLTAVGDSNQAIMRWAGARVDIFNQFEADFGASDDRLLFNFRSNSRIVKLINELAATFDDSYMPTECAREGDPVPQNPVEGWVFDTRKAEGEYIASFIASELRQNPLLTPADFVILARLRVNDIEVRIKEAFSNHGLKLRNEARSVAGIAIQDLVKGKCYSFLLATLKLAANVRIGQPFQECRDVIADVRGADLDSDRGHSETLHAVKNLVNDLVILIDKKDPSQVTGEQITNVILLHITRDELRHTYREYMSDDFLNSTISGFEAFLDECRKESKSWPECITNMEGHDSIRLMTIHKSKGLEYHTVFFIEFNDDSFWGNNDDVNVFFVALSRARERVYFSFTRDSKGISNIKNICENLQFAKVSFYEKP